MGWAAGGDGPRSCGLAVLLRSWQRGKNQWQWLAGEGVRALHKYLKRDNTQSIGAPQKIEPVDQ